MIATNGTTSLQVTVGCSKVLDKNLFAMVKVDYWWGLASYNKWSDPVVSILEWRVSWSKVLSMIEELSQDTLNTYRKRCWYNNSEDSASEVNTKLEPVRSVSVSGLVRSRTLYQHFIICPKVCVIVHNHIVAACRLQSTQQISQCSSHWDYHCEILDACCLQISVEKDHSFRLYPTVIEHSFRNTGFWHRQSQSAYSLARQS